MRTFQQILEAAGYETSAYSGRGMGIETCLGVHLSNGDIGRLFAEVLAEVGQREQVPAAAAFLRMRTDALGRGIVVYFPGIAHE